MEVELRRLFDIRSGHYHALKELGPGTIPLVSCGDINHGFIGRYDIPRERRFSDVITVAYNGRPLTAKFRPYEFGAKDDIGVLVPREDTDAHSLVYVAAVLNASRWRYSYGRKCFKGKLGTFVVDVPVRSGVGAPCIDGARIRDILGATRLDRRPRLDSDTASAARGIAWTRKRLDEIFRLVRGDFHSLGALGPGSWPTVSRTTNDNGVTGYYERPEDCRVYPPGTITVSTVGGDAFVQPREFIVTDNVVVLEPHADMPLETVVLLCAMVNEQKWRYGYGRQCYLQKLSAMTVEVPWRAGGLDHEAARSVVRGQPYWRYVSRAIATGGP